MYRTLADSQINIDASLGSLSPKEIGATLSDLCRLQVRIWRRGPMANYGNRFVADYRPLLSVIAIQKAIW